VGQPAAGHPLPFLSLPGQQYILAISPVDVDPRDLPFFFPLSLQCQRPQGTSRHRLRFIFLGVSLFLEFVQVAKSPSPLYFTPFLFFLRSFCWGLGALATTSSAAVARNTSNDSIGFPFPPLTFPCPLLFSSPFPYLFGSESGTKDVPLRARFCFFFFVLF